MLVTLTSPLTLGKSMFSSRVKERPQGSGERELKSPTHTSPYISCLISSWIVWSKTWAHISSHLPDLAIIIALNCQSRFLNKNLSYFKRLFFLAHQVAEPAKHNMCWLSIELKIDFQALETKYANLFIVRLTFNHAVVFLRVFLRFRRRNKSSNRRVVRLGAK